jgi:hypothetical protein
MLRIAHERAFIRIHINEGATSSASSVVTNHCELKVWSDTNTLSFCNCNPELHVYCPPASRGLTTLL